MKSEFDQRMSGNTIIVKREQLKEALKEAKPRIGWQVWPGSQKKTKISEERLKIIYTSVLGNKIFDTSVSM